MLSLYTGLKLKGYQGQEIEVLSFNEKFNMYQCKETKDNIVGNPLLSEQDIIDLLGSQSKIKESEKAMQQAKEKQEQEQRELEQSLSIGNFLINNPKLHMKAKNTLNKQIKYNGIWTTRKEYTEQLANGNENVETVIYKGKYQYRFIDESALLEITKTEADYFNYLKGIDTEINEINYQAI